MSSEGIQFDEDNLSNQSRRTQQSIGGANSSQSGLIGWMISHGIAKSPAMAQGILLALVIVFVLLTYLIVR